MVWEKKNRLSDAKVGAFVLVALAILIAGTLWIAGTSLLGPPRVTYTILLQDSAGLRAGDRVRYAGVAVGRIQDVSLLPEEVWPVRMEVSLRPDIPVKTDSRAQIGTSGIFGEVFLEIQAGSPKAPLLAPGGLIESDVGAGFEATMAHVDELATQATGLLVKTSSLVEQLSSQISPVLSNLEQLLSAENTEHVRLLLADLSQLSATAGPRLTQILDRLEESIEGVPELRDQFAGLATSLDHALGPDGARLAAVLDQAQEDLDRAGGVLSVVEENRDELEWALRDLRDTLANLKAFSEEIEQRPYSLVRIKPRPDRAPGEPSEGDR